LYLLCEISTTIATLGKELGSHFLATFLMETVGMIYPQY
jgi:hypothetical protein